MEPVKRVLDKRKCSRLIRLPIDDGIPPVNPCPLISKVTRFIKSNIVDGISPDKPLPIYK